MDTKLDTSTSSELGVKATQKSSSRCLGALDKVFLDAIHKDTETQYSIITDKYPKHPSLQHSMYILQEEFNEVLEEMKAKDGSWCYSRMYCELIDLIAAAYRMIMDSPDLAAYTGNFLSFKE